MIPAVDAVRRAPRATILRGGWRAGAASNPVASCADGAGARDVDVVPSHDHNVERPARAEAAMSRKLDVLVATALRALASMPAVPPMLRCLAGAAADRLGAAR